MQESSRKTTSSSLDNISQWPSWKPVSRCVSPDCRFFCPSMGSVNQDCYLRNQRRLLWPSVMAHYASASLSNSYFRELNNASTGRRKIKTRPQEKKTRIKTSMDKNSRMLSLRSQPHSWLQLYIYNNLNHPSHWNTSIAFIQAFHGPVVDRKKIIKSIEESMSQHGCIYT